MSTSFHPTNFRDLYLEDSVESDKKEVTLFDIIYIKGKFGVFRRDTSPFSIYYPEPFTYNSVKYDCVAHAFYRAKFSSASEQTLFDKLYDNYKLRGFTTGLSSRMANRDLKLCWRKDWVLINIQTMKDILKVKYNKEPSTAYLKSTKGMFLAEHSVNKRWSNGFGNGQNLLSIILMELRGDIISEPDEYLKWLNSEIRCSNCKIRLTKPTEKYCSRLCNTIASQRCFTCKREVKTEIKGGITKQRKFCNKECSEKVLKCLVCKRKCYAHPHLNYCSNDCLRKLSQCIICSKHFFSMARIRSRLRIKYELTHGEKSSEIGDTKCCSKDCADKLSQCIICTASFFPKTENQCCSLDCADKLSQCIVCTSSFFPKTENQCCSLDCSDKLSQCIVCTSSFFPKTENQCCSLDCSDKLSKCVICREYSKCLICFKCSVKERGVVTFDQLKESLGF